MAVCGRLVHHPGTDDEGRVRRSEVLRLPGDEHQEWRPLPRPDAGRRSGLLVRHAGNLRTQGRIMRITMVGLGFVLMSLGQAAAAPPPPPDVTVAARDGLYHVAATFRISAPASIAFAVLTDYE